MLKSICFLVLLVKIQLLTCSQVCVYYPHWPSHHDKSTTCSDICCSTKAYTEQTACCSSKSITDNLWWVFKIIIPIASVIIGSFCIGFGILLIKVCCGKVCRPKIAPARQVIQLAPFTIPESHGYNSITIITAPSNGGVIPATRMPDYIPYQPYQPIQIQPYQPAIQGGKSYYHPANNDTTMSRFYY